MLALLAPLASLLGVEAEGLTDRLRRNAAVLVTVGVLVAIGVVFLLVGANAALTLKLGPIYAPLVIGAAALVIALLVYGIARLVRNAERRREAARRRSSEQSALLTTAALTALPLLLKSPLLRTAGLPLGALAIAAYFLTRPPAKPDSSVNSRES